MFQSVLLVATMLCALVAGFLFAFAIVVMPGIRRLDAGAFIKTFQAIDGVIQNNQPLFIFVWVGSVLALIAALVLGVRALDGVDEALVAFAPVIYLRGVQLPTFAINIPLNNGLQKLDPAGMNEVERRRARVDFETRWNRWNNFRTACASLT